MVLCCDYTRTKYSQQQQQKTDTINYLRIFGYKILITYNFYRVCDATIAMCTVFKYLNIFTELK